MTDLILALKQHYFQYVSLLPLVHEQKLKPPLNWNYLLDLQYSFLNKLLIQNIPSHLIKLDKAINSCLISICGKGAFNLLPIQIKDTLEIKESLMDITCNSNGFFNYSLTHKEPPSFSKNHINNGKLDIYFEQNLIRFKHNNAKINLSYTFNKRFSSAKTLEGIKSDNNITRYMSEQNNKFINIKQLVTVGNENNKIKIHIFIDRKTANPINFSFKINQGDAQKKQIKSIGQLGRYHVYNYGTFAIILDNNPVYTGDNSYCYHLKKIENFSKTIRECFEIELVFSNKQDFCNKNELINTLHFKNCPLRIINTNKNMLDKELFYTECSDIELLNIYIDPVSFNYILELKNNSNENVLSVVRYLNLHPDYLIDNNFNKISRVFSGIKFSPHQKILCLFKKKIQIELE